MGIRFRRLTFPLTAALAVGSLLGNVSHGAEPLVDPFVDRAQLTFPLSNYEPIGVPAVSEGLAAQGAASDDPASPSDATPIEYEIDFAPQQQPLDLYEALGDECCEPCRGGRFGHGIAFGQYPDNWMWGVGGSPFRTGPDCCDDWKVGPVWDVSVDGMTLFRDDADLAALEAMARMDDPMIMFGDPRETQFGYSGGARIYAMGKLPRFEKYQIQFGYEGIEEWNAALLFPEQDVPVPVDPDGMAGTGDEYEYETDVLRSLHYRSSMHSAEFNFYRRPVRTLRPFWGIRYVRFTDEITDTTDQDAPFPPPLVGAMPDPAANALTLEDSLDFIDIKNNLVGFQVGIREDLWHLNRRVTVQGFVNAGVYYNRIQFAQGSIDTTTTFIPDDGTTLDTDESRTLTSSTSSLSSSEPSDIAYLAEASITAICRLNKCVALRGGYQLFWIDGLALAEDAYLDNALDRHDFLMQGWHVGLEYRR